eukprot:s3581_g14.t1
MYTAHAAMQVVRALRGLTVYFDDVDPDEIRSICHVVQHVRKACDPKSILAVLALISSLGFAAMFETLVTALQICCQSAVLGDLWGRWSAHMAHKRHKRFEDYLTCPAEVIGRLGSMIGEGCYGRVYKLYRASGNGEALAVKMPKKDGPMAAQSVQILLQECYRASNLSHSNIVKALGVLGTMTLWQLAEGLPWEQAQRILPLPAKCQVARQFASVGEYLTKMTHVMWDIHEADVLVEPSAPHLMLLDCYMEPNENAGCLYTLPPMLRWQFPEKHLDARNLRRVMERLGAAMPATVNGYVTALFMASMLFPNVTLKQIALGVKIRTREDPIEMHFKRAANRSLRRQQRREKRPFIALASCMAIR